MVNCEYCVFKTFNYECNCVCLDFECSNICCVFCSRSEFWCPACECVAFLNRIFTKYRCFASFYCYSLNNYIVNFKVDFECFRKNFIEDCVECLSFISYAEAINNFAVFCECPTCKFVSVLSWCCCVNDFFVFNNFNCSECFAVNYECDCVLCWFFNDFAVEYCNYVYITC